MLLVKIMPIFVLVVVIKLIEYIENLVSVKMVGMMMVHKFAKNVIKSVKLVNYHQKTVS